jgi:enoyl-CoA hydratase/carnithine racemase
MMNNSTTVTFEQRDGVGVIAFHRPPANAYEIEFHRQFNVAIEQADADAAWRLFMHHRRAGFSQSQLADERIISSDNFQIIARSLG